jgi:REP element-mobilizing transposase RayT
VQDHLKRIPVWLPTDAAIIYFVTCCTASRQKLLANAQAHEAIRVGWQRVADWRIGRYVVMPDHIHFFIAPLDRDASLSKCVQSFRSFVTKTLRPPGYPYPLWQREFFDHLLRSNESYAAKWEYVRYNPVRHGLAKGPEDWPYAGEISALEI